MQKIINVLAVASFAMSGSIVGGGAYIWAQRDVLQEQFQSELAGRIKDAIGSAVGGGILGGDESPLPIELPFGR